MRAYIKWILAIIVVLLILFVALFIFTGNLTDQPKNCPVNRGECLSQKCVDLNRTPISMTKCPEGEYCCSTIG